MTDDLNRFPDDDKGGSKDCFSNQTSDLSIPSPILGIFTIINLL